jgi:glycerophosphoryl diester phosphodiesterase
MAPWPYPRWIAHRGAGKLAPENTLAAFRLGASYGYRMFECDAKLSADGVPFLMHDPTLDRTTNAREIFGPAPSNVGGDHPWGELARLDAGSWHSPPYVGEPLPTLENLCRFCLANGYLLDLEIKPTPGTERATGEVIARHADRLWNNAPVPPLFTSFKPAALEGALAIAAHLPRGLLVDEKTQNWLQTALELECAAVVFDHELVDGQIVAQAKGAGLRMLCYTVNEQPAVDALGRLDIDGIITDRVDLFLPV